MKRHHLVGSAVLAAITLAGMEAMAQAQQGGYEHGHGWHGSWSGGWGGMIFGPFMMILFVAAVVFLVVVALRWLGAGHGPTRGPDGKAALDILEERFARGEIDRDEFEERRRTLRG